MKWILFINSFCIFPIESIRVCFSVLSLLFVLKLWFVGVLCLELKKV